MKNLLTEKEINQFQKNGAVFIKRKFDKRWIEKLRNGIDIDINILKLILIRIYNCINIANIKYESNIKKFSKLIINNNRDKIFKEISNLQASINTLKLDLHQTVLEHEVITSPENISRLAKEYLESDFAFYKKSQIKQLNEKEKTLAKLEEKKVKKIFKKKSKVKTDEIKLRIVKKIETTKTELRKLQELYSEPEKLPGVVKLKVAKTIEIKKNALKEFSSDPYSVFKSKKARNWAGLQIVKVFLGIPIMPGR